MCESAQTLHFPHRRPVRPEPGEHSQRSRFIQGEPDVPAFGLVELAERRERHNTAVFNSQPPLPVLAGRVSDVRCASIRLHPQKLFKIRLLAFGTEFVGPLGGGVELGLLR